MYSPPLPGRGFPSGPCRSREAMPHRGGETGAVPFRGSGEVCARACSGFRIRSGAREEDGKGGEGKARERRRDFRSRALDTASVCARVGACLGGDIGFSRGIIQPGLASTPNRHPCTARSYYSRVRFGMDQWASRKPHYPTASDHRKASIHRMPNCLPHSCHGN